MIARMIAILSVPAMLAATPVHVLFLGPIPGGAPAFEQSYSRQLRAKLATTTSLSLVDQEQTNEFRKSVGFDAHPEITDPMIAYVDEYFAESTVVAWAQVRNYTIKGMRHFLVRAELHGEITIDLVMYSAAEKSYFFLGDIHASVTRPAGFIFFDPVDKMEINGVARSEVMDMLAGEAVEKSADMIGSITYAILSAQKKAAEESEETAPSIRDLFDMPSVEAKPLEKSDTATAPVSASATPKPPKRTPKPSPRIFIPVFGQTSPAKPTPRPSATPKPAAIRSPMPAPVQSPIAPAFTRAPVSPSPAKSAADVPKSAPNRDTLLPGRPR